MGSSLMQGNRHNPHGFYEDNDFRRLDKEILHAAGGRGADPGHIPPSAAMLDHVRRAWAPKIETLIRRKEAAGHELWGWKDPRMALLAPQYNPHLTHPHYIAVFREPLEAAKSLQKMLGWDIDRCLALGKTYNERILSFLREFAGL